MNFNILTLGCKVNQYESQAMREALIKNGFTPSDDKDRADITVINSCTVTSVSDSKNRKLINRIRRNNPHSVIVLTGCMPQAFPDEMEAFTNCDIIFGNTERARLVPAINEYISSGNRVVSIPVHANKDFKFEKMTVSSFDEHTRAFSKK